MTFDQALQSLQEQFGAFTDDLVPGETVEICSGGKPVEIDGERQPPVLCATRELAIASWLTSMRRFLRENTPASWQIVDGPHIDKFFMTMMDERKTQRIAAERYCVSARIGFTRKAANGG